MSQFKELESVVIRFAGDSGDGMQTIGEQFTDSSAFAGNDISTLPDFPAEIRAPAGTLPGVSGFQIQFGSKEILTPGDAPDALVAMNPAALKTNLDELVPGGLLIMNAAAFNAANLEMAGYATNPLDDQELEVKYDVIKIDINKFTLDALQDIDTLKSKEKLRCKNFFALGFMYWVYDRPLDPTIEFLNKKWAKRLPHVAEANIKVLKAGYFFGETTETSRNRYRIEKAEVEAGLYRKIAGNEALVYGLMVGAEKCQRPLLYSGYPITPASSILETISRQKNFGVKTVQAEDEIAAIGVAIGASFAGSLGVTGTSGPGMCLKSEFIGLAVITELPLIICNVQRGGPSTGLPTKTEQGDLLQCMYGRNSDSPIPIVAASTPSDCFASAIEAARIAVQYSTPVILMSDLYLANGSEPWKIPTIADIPEFKVPFLTEIPTGPFDVYAREPETLSRRQAIPGQPGLEHRIGGLEKNASGGVSYDPENHETMTKLRDAKVQRIANSLPPLTTHGASQGDLLVLGWGSSYGSITSAVKEMQSEGYRVSSLHLRHINPFPNDLGDILKRFKQVLIPELNLGQLSLLIRAKYLIDAIGYHKVQGKPFTVTDIKNKISAILKTA